VPVVLRACSLSARRDARRTAAETAALRRGARGIPLIAHGTLQAHMQSAQMSGELGNGGVARHVDSGQGKAIESIPIPGFTFLLRDIPMLYVQKGAVIAGFASQANFPLSMVEGFPKG
jgi:hypothetical protein